MILIVFTLTNLFEGLFFCGYTPVEISLRRIWGISTDQVVWTSTASLLGVVVMIVFFNFFSERLSLVQMNLVGLSLCCVGFGLKFLLTVNFLFCVLAQFLIGMGTCFTINIQLTVCFSYFSDKYLSLCVPLVTLSNIIGDSHKVLAWGTRISSSSCRMTLAHPVRRTAGNTWFSTS